MGPQPRVIPTNIEGMKETDPEPSLKAFLSSTTQIPRVYVIPSAAKIFEKDVSFALVVTQKHVDPIT